jgi:hypothetical protein
VSVGRPLTTAERNDHIEASIHDMHYGTPLDSLHTTTPLMRPTRTAKCSGRHTLRGR